MRYLLARHGCELLARGASAQAAADEAIRGFGERIGGRGGLILLDRQGRVGLAKNTKTMSYAVASLAAETRCGI